jgi:hypothetical protein
MKHLFTAAALLFGMTVLAQVGINNTFPKATLDITAKTTDGSKPEGLIAPRLKGNEIQSGTYGSDQKGAIIYATTAATTPNAVTINITQPGYYYFDGSVWQKVITGSVANSDLATGAGGIYKGSGSLSGNTTVTQDTNTLAFTSSASTGTSHFTVDGTTLNVDAVNNRVGIGTSSPGNLLEISSSSSNTGLKLPYGAAAGKILTSDATGNSSWQTSNSVFIYSEVHSTGNSTSFPAGSVVNFFHTIKGENVKTVYGNSYGWIDASQRWVAPYTGKYRVTTNMYFNITSSVNPRLYAYINGTTVCNITSGSNTGSSDGTSYTSAIVSLNQGDYIQWKTATAAVLYGADYHTFIRVESVE